MSICSVCGKNVPNIAAQIVRGKSGEWVCKECLTKAGIGSIKFSNTFITSDQIESLINKRNPVHNENISTLNNSVQGDNQSTQTKVRCSKCGTVYVGNFCPKGCNSPYYQSKKKKGKGGIVAIVIIGIFAFAATMGILFGEETPDTASSTPTKAIQSEQQIEYIEVSAQDLWNAFADNEVAADEKYKGEYVKVTGIVNNINSKDVLTSANILLDVDGEIFGCIQCNFNSENAKAIANIQKGQKVTVTGTCGGLELYNIMINGCELQ